VFDFGKKETYKYQHGQKYRIRNIE
jgi:hypothetical protein